MPSRVAERVQVTQTLPVVEFIMELSCIAEWEWEWAPLQ
jgi:hypothetical protein